MQSQQYTLTNRLMGDPRPDRFAWSERLHATKKVRPVASVIPVDPNEKIGDRLNRTLKAVAEGHDTSRKIMPLTGWKFGAAASYLRRLRSAGLLSSRDIKRTVQGGGLTRVYQLTDAGREELRRLGAGKP